MDLPIIKLTIDEQDETRVEKISFVDDPAIERQWMAFKKSPYRFKADEEKRVVSGPLMVAGLPIYRHDEKNGEYYVQFDADSIQRAVLKFFNEQRMSGLDRLKLTTMRFGLR